MNIQISAPASVVLASMFSLAALADEITLPLPSVVERDEVVPVEVIVEVDNPSSFGGWLRVQAYREQFDLWFDVGEEYPDPGTGIDMASTPAFFNWSPVAGTSTFEFDMKFRKNERVRIFDVQTSNVVAVKVLSGGQP